MQLFDTYGFLDDTWPLIQTNWAAYFSPVIPDGVIAGAGRELLVAGNSTGMNVTIQPGECRVRSHRGEISEIKALEIPTADATYPRIDLVVARVDYSAPNMVLAVRQGTPAQEPVAPEPVQNAGDVWEIPLAEVTVAEGAITIDPADVKDRRYVYQTGGAAATSFSGTALTVANDWEYRQSAEIDSLVITLPSSPSETFMCSVCFTASASFTGVTFQRGGEAYTIKTTDVLNAVSVRYNLVLWWDGAFFWCASKAA